MLIDDECYLMPGIFDCISARIAEMTGFSVISITGNGLSASVTGLPDMGLISLKEVVDAVHNISQSISIPVIADGDTGFGNALNVMRTVELFERAGAAAIHLEDQALPKKCAYYDGSRALVDVSEQTGKLKAAAAARSCKDFVIIARTDALRPYGIDDTIHRLKAYEQSGADVAFVVGIETLEQLSKIRLSISIPILINVNDGDKLSKFSKETLAAAGAKFIMYPATARSAMLYSVEKALKSLAQNGYSREKDNLASLSEFNRVVKLERYEKHEEMYLQG